MLPFLCSCQDQTSKSFLTQASWGSSELSPANGGPSCRHFLLESDEMGVWETGKTYELDSAWKSRNRLPVGNQEHNCCSPCQVFTPQKPKSKVQMNSIARLILPITLFEGQWWNFKRCRKRSQDAESQVPSRQSGPLVLHTMVLVPLLTQNWVFPGPCSWCGQTPVLGWPEWPGQHHKPAPGWAGSPYPRIAGMGLEANFPSSLTDC